MGMAMKMKIVMMDGNAGDSCRTYIYIICEYGGDVDDQRGLRFVLFVCVGGAKFWHSNSHSTGEQSPIPQPPHNVHQAC